MGSGFTIAVVLHVQTLWLHWHNTIHHTCSLSGAVVGFTISFCTTATRTIRWERLSSSPATGNLYPSNWKLAAPAFSTASCGSSNLLLWMRAIQSDCKDEYLRCGRPVKDPLHFWCFSFVQRASWFLQQRLQTLYFSSHFHLLACKQPHPSPSTSSTWSHGWSVG